ncbi:MAG: hypothetical protein KDA89_13410, partial [Planctomycetaceae bacterium]|nr:hypothetical protein [Planctomycetaceae bacterium]
MLLFDRREFLRQSVGAIACSGAEQLFGADGPDQNRAACEVLLPRNRVPVGLIIDDSTCLVNLNRFAMPQFAAAFGGKNKNYDRDWK